MIMLQIVVGLVFVMLLFSLLATTVMELIASGLSLRGKNLEKALKNMLSSANTDTTLYKTFTKNPLFKQLSQRFMGKHYSPSYMSASTFQSILFNTILDGQTMDKLIKQIDEIPDENLKKVLKQFLNDSNHDLETFEHKVQTWYDNVMDRAKGWYKRSTQKILIIVGAIIALIFNADAISIYQNLSSNPDNLADVVSLADAFVKNNPTIAIDTNFVIRDSINIDTTFSLKQTTGDEAQEFLNTLDDVKVLINQEIENVKSPLGLGWKHFNYVEASWFEWLLKIVGWTVTVLAISLGAPFWFDILKKLVNVRSSGNKSS